MTADVPRLRMFAGPNGSGKTTVKNELQKPPSWFGIYINPDEIEKTIREEGRLALEPFGLTTTTAELQTWLASSTLLQKQGLTTAAHAITCDNNVLDLHGLAMNSYYASALAEFLRRKALEQRRSFSFETVMSEPGKVALLREAQALGYRTYLYYVATEDPAINIERVKNRVAEGGHDVPEDKIISRYTRSLELLRDAIRYTNRAYFFDTSEPESVYIAEVTDGTDIEMHTDAMPNWFETYVWDKL